MAPRPGETILGKYLVERVLGQGGMGVVLAARHQQLGQLVAIKVLTSEPEPRDGDLDCLRGLREARAAVQIASEHIARVLDFATDDAGRPHIVMEYLEGTDLAALLKAHGPVPIPYAVGYILHACEALVVAHAARIIHRDLKPANLFLTQRRDGTPLVKVLDFGISRILERSSREIVDDEITANLVVGSVPHTSPEQLTTPGEIDERADVWGLGSVLYQLLAGVPAFGPGPVGQVITSILTEAPPPLAGRRPEVPPELAAVVMSCLAKAPEDRPGDVPELAAALLPWAPSWAAPSAHVEGAVQDATVRFWFRRQRRRRISLAAVATLAAAATVFVWHATGEREAAVGNAVARVVSAPPARGSGSAAPRAPGGGGAATRVVRVPVPAASKPATIAVGDPSSRSSPRGVPSVTARRSRPARVAGRRRVVPNVAKLPPAAPIDPLEGRR